MKRQKIYKKPRSSFTLKFFLFLWKVVKFFMVVFLYLFSSNSKRKNRYEPTVPEQILGENIPFSDQYYIPDDHR
jgi:hypothetical protein